MTRCTRIALFFCFLISLPGSLSYALPPAPVAQTGQTGCWDATGIPVTCSGTGQDGDLKNGFPTPAPHFTDNGDGTITDNLTSLTWSKDANAATIPKTWQQALDYIKTLNSQNYMGHNDWRLPNINELKTLINKDPANLSNWLATQGFTNVQPSFYWSSSTYASAGNKSAALIVYLDQGYLAYNYKTSTVYVWPVRGGQTGSFNSLTIAKTGQTSCWDSNGAAVACANTGQDGETQTGTAIPNQRFSYNGDLTITDQATGLIWSKDANAPGPASCNGGNPMLRQGALDYVKCLNSHAWLGYTDWRLPNLNELSSLADWQQNSNVNWLTVNGFNNVQSNYYWSSTGLPNYPSATWLVNVDFEYMNNAGGNAVNYVWPVRSGQYRPLGSLIVFGNPTISSSPVNQPAPFSVKQLEIKNLDAAAATVSAISLSGSNASEFSVAPGGTAPCASLTPTLAAGASCTVLVRALPTSLGAKTASISFASAGLSLDVPLATSAISTIYGSVTDKNTGLPLGGATVTLFNGPSVTTAADGSYTFSSLDAGTYYLTVTDSGYLSTTAGNLTVSSTQSARTDLSLKPAATRFVDHQDGTLTDTQSNLTWLKNANCFGAQVWSAAVSASNALGSGQCGLFDGSQAGDWHLPSATEVSTFMGATPYVFLSGVGFTNVVNNEFYWSSTPIPTNPAAVYDTYTVSGVQVSGFLTQSSYTWPARGGQYWTFDPFVISSVKSPAMGVAPVGLTSAPQLFNILNSGSQLLSLTGINITGPDPGQFNVVPGGANPCASLSPTIAAGSACSVSVTTAPTTSGVKVGALTATTGGQAYFIPMTVSAIATVVGTVTDQATGLPVSGATVALAGGATTTTAADGTYSFGPLAAGTYSVSVTNNGYQTVNAGNLVVTGSASALANILLPTTGPLNINTTALPSATAGTAYSTRVTVGGGSAPYSFSIGYGGLPAGLALEAGTGVISGTPTGSGSFIVDVAVTDNAGGSVDREFTLDLVQPLVISTSTLPRGTTGTPYSVPLVAAGGKAPLNYSVSSGGLPAGVSLSATSGSLSGVPTATGDFSCTVTVSDATGRAVSRQLTASVDAPLAVVSSGLDTAKKGIPYSFTPAATGGYSSRSWSIQSGVLPAGLSLDPATGGISGTPTESVTRAVTLMVQDSYARVAFASFPLTVTVPLAFTATKLPNAYNGAPYAEFVAMTGGLPPYSFRQSGLPSGLSLNAATGAITGSSSINGGNTVSVTVSDSSTPTPQSITQNFSLRTTTLITPTSTGRLPNARKGTALPPYVLGASGGTPPYGFTLIGGALPGGVSFDPSGATLSGTPSEAGDFSFTVHLADSLGNSTGGANAAFDPDKVYTLHVSDTLAVTTAAIPTAALNAPYSYPLLAGGGLPPLSWSVAAGALPPGMAVNGSAGVISGTPTAGGSYSFDLLATDSDLPPQTARTTLALTVSSVLSVVDTAVPSARVNVPYSAKIRAQNGSTPYSWSTSSGALPAGLSFSVSNGIAVLSGTPTSVGNASFTLQVTDGGTPAQTSATPFTLSVLPALSLTGGPLAPVVTGAQYAQTLSAAGGQPPYLFGLSSGSLPQGLFLNSATGAISGTTASTGGSSFTVTLTDAGIPSQSVSQNYTMAVLVPVAVSKSSAAAGSVSSVPAGISCDTACSSSSGSFAAGTGVTISAAPAPGYFVAGWSGCDSSGGNSCSVSAVSGAGTITVSFSRQMASSLSVGPPVTSIKQNAPVTLSGVLGTVPLSSGSYLAGQSVTVAVTKPDGSVASYTATTADNNGSWSLQLPAIFFAAGTYLASASFAGSDQLIGTGSPSVSILMDKSAGYAIVVTGMRSDASLLSLHNNTANAVVNTLKARGFLDANILVLESSASAAVTPDQVGTAITSWAKGKLADTAAPLYLIMVDHGSAGAGFVMGNSVLTPAALKGYLDTLEGDPSVAASVANYPRFVIIGTCYSGQFIPVLSAPGRVIITSAGPAEESIANITMYDATSRSTYSSGEYFVDSLFSFLGRGSTFQDAFTRAAGALPGKDVRRSASNSFRFGVWDNLMQHPLLDDAGSGSGSYQLGAGSDGALVASLKLGVGVATNGGDNPADIKSVTPPTTLDPSTTSAGVWLEANFDPRVGTAWVDIRTPDSSASGEGSGGQVLINLQTLPLVHNATTGRWELTWNGFTTAGRYDIFYNTVDAQTGEQSAPVQSTVYKNLAGNSPPAPFDLIYSDLVDPFSQDPRDFVPTWTPSSDPDGFSYTLQVATDQNFDNIVYSEADIQQEATIIPVTALLQDPTVAESYYCKNGDSYCSMRVLAVDSYGATTVSDTFRTFTLFDGNGSYAFITGYVVNAATNLPVAGAVVGTGSGATATTAANGSYILTRSSGNGYTLSVTAPGFQPSSVNIAAVAGINKVQFSLSSNLATPVNGLCGASNGQLFGSAPSANLCAAGSVSAAPAGAAPWSWSCAGSNGGSSASCTALSTQQIAVGTAAPASAPYNSQFTVAATASSGLAVSYSSGSPTVCNNSGASFTMLAASGSCVVQYDQGGNGSFGPATRVSSSVSAATASQSISFALPASAGYGDAAVSLSASASSGLSVSFHLVSGPGSISNNQLSITGAGVITVAADQGGSALYAAAPEQLRQITVAKAPLSVTADNQGRPFNTANPTLTASYSGFVNGDGAGALSGAPALATGATQSSPAGSYPITVSQGSLASANYSFTLVNGTLTVAPDTSAYPVTGNSGGNGTISCVSPVTAGNSTTCTLSPAPGYRVSSVSGCGSGVLNGTLYTTGVISGACTVSASFSAGSASGKPGDCNRDGMVTISEVQGAINMFLGLQAVGTCVDLDGSGTVSLSEVQQVINAFLGL